MPFEKYSRSTARTATGSKWLSIQGNGSISVSYTAILEIGEPETVHLFFDPETHRIAIKAAPEDSKDAYKARLQGRGDNPKSARVVSSTAFFNYINLDAQKAAGRYDVIIEDGMVISKIPADAFA